MTDRLQEATALIKDVKQELQSFGHCRQEKTQWYRGEVCQCRHCLLVERIERWELGE